MKGYTKFILCITLLYVVNTSCKKMIEVATPRNQLVTSTVFKDSADATAAVVGMYSSMMRLSTVVNFANGAITRYTGLCGDELYTTSSNPEILQFYANAILKENTENAELWRYAYEIIYQANACIEGLSASTDLKSSVKNQLIGEAEFIRSLFYFNLVNLYGDIPLVTTIDYHSNAVLPRTSAALVYDQVVTDLLDAEEKLSINYVTAGRLRPNRYAAIALLARVYLYQMQWAKAEAEATKIINAGVYSIEPNLNNVFLKSSTESIWQMPPLQSGLGTPECRQFVPLGSAIPAYPITNSLLNSFENNDQRKLKWINSRIIGGITYFFPFKYKLRVTGNPDENYIMLRFAEQYLIRSEARAKQNDLINAVIDLNIIRNRAGLPATATINQSTLLTAIYHERQVELFCEWGHRWYDLKRTDAINTVLAIIKPGWQATDALYPIPYNETQTNPFLNQNPGY